MSDLMKQPQSSEWMIVYTTHNLPEAYIIGGRLDADGIPNVIHREAGASAIGVHIGRLGEIKVLVSPKDYNLAVRLLFPEEFIDNLPDRTDVIQMQGDEDEYDETSAGP